MTEGDFPFRNFTVRAEGYDRGEVEAYVAQLQGDVAELRRNLDAMPSGDSADARLHDPEGAVTRTLAIAQETADRVLHDAQVEADRRRTEADEHAASTIADADRRAAKMLDDIETQTAEVRAQGIAAARAAIQVERDKAVAELGQIRRVRDDIRAEAVELKSVLDRYSRQAIEASEVLSAAATGPLMSFELPEFVAADVALAGIVDEDEFVVDAAPLGLVGGATAPDVEASEAAVSEIDGDTTLSAPEADADDDEFEPTWSAESTTDRSATDDQVDDLAEPVWGDDDGASVAPVAADTHAPEPPASDDNWFADDVVDNDDESLAEVISIDAEPPAPPASLPSDLDADPVPSGSGTFLAEVRAAADDDDPVGLPSEAEGGLASDRFLSELRGVTELPNLADSDIDEEAADRFFEPE